MATSRALKPLADYSPRLAVQRFMSRSSSTFTEAHFDAKAGRYRRAIESSPAARSLEVAPFLRVLGSSLPAGGELRCADLLCGSGVLSTAMGEAFSEVAGVDVSARMLEGYPRGGRYRTVRMTIDDEPRLLAALGPAHAVVSLAGLHHVYVEDDRGLRAEETGALQARVVAAACRALTDGGTFILADVSHPGWEGNYSADRRELPGMSPIFRRLWRRSVSTLARMAGSPELGAASSLGAFASVVATTCRSLHRPEPGRWFDEFVSPNSAFGHVAAFPNPDELVSGVARTANYSLQHHELPVPWLFDSENDLVFYFHEKFALGPAAESIHDLSPTRRRWIIQAIEHYLGLHRFERGAVAAGWRLGYYIATTEPCRK